MDGCKMKVKELQKNLQQAITYFSKFKPSDNVMCDTGEEYSSNYWNDLYMTVDNGDMAHCGIFLSNKIRNGPNKIMTPAEYEKFLIDTDYDGPDERFQIRNVKKILIDAVRTLKNLDQEAEVEIYPSTRNLKEPFVCIYDDEIEDFRFLSLYDIKAEDTFDDEDLDESKQISFMELKKLIYDS